MEFFMLENDVVHNCKMGMIVFNIMAKHFQFSF